VFLRSHPIVGCLHAPRQQSLAASAVAASHSTACSTSRTVPAHGSTTHASPIAPAITTAVVAIATTKKPTTAATSVRA